MTTTAGRLKVKRHQTGYAANNASLPTHVKVSPFDDPLIAVEFGLSLDFDTEVIEATVGHAKANIAGMLALEGSFAFQEHLAATRAIKVCR